jgi:hypothetical protein
VVVAQVPLDVLHVQVHAGQRVYVQEGLRWVERDREQTANRQFRKQTESRQEADRKQTGNRQERCREDDRKMSGGMCFMELIRSDLVWPDLI